MGVTAETYAWPEGELLIWTGSAASVGVGRMNNSTHQIVHGWLNAGPSLSGVYTDHLTGKRANVSIAAGFTYDTELIRIMQAATAVHIEARYSSVNGSAGWKFYSGRIDSQTVQGGAAGLFNFTMTYHSNDWSAYGG